VQPINATIKPGDTGPQVTNLQDALSLMLQRGVVKALDPPNTPTAQDLAELAKRLVHERAIGSYDGATQAIVRFVQIQGGLGDGLGGVVEETTAALLNKVLSDLGALDPPAPDGESFVVKGRVTHASGAPAQGLLVRARDRDVRTFQPLGDQDVTDADGRYEIPYTRQQFAAAEDGYADLVIRVFSADAGADPDLPLAESVTMFNAPATAEIDVELADGVPPAEFDQLAAAIPPLLVGQASDGSDLALADITEADADFLAGDTGLDRGHIAWLGTAFAFAQRAGDKVPAALFYGWFREGQPDDWDELIGRSITVLRTAASSAIDHEIISASLGDGVEAALAALPNAGRDTVRSIVTLTGMGEDAVGTLLERAGGVAELGNPLITTLVDSGRLSPDDAHRVGLALTAHDVVDGDQASVAALLQAGPALQRARDLAGLDAPAIERALEAAKVAPPAGLDLPAYAGEVEARIAARFPTEALLRRVSTVPDGPRCRAPDRSRACRLGRRCAAAKSRR